MKRSRKMPRGGVFFLIVMIAALFVAHWAVYAALVFSFGVTDSTALVCLKIGLALMTLGFMATMAVIRTKNTLVTRTAYKIVATWIGLFFYLLLASVVALVVHIRVVGEVAFIVAVATAVSGLVQAATIRITSYRVMLPNLPESWKGKSIAFISDIHLGQIYGKSFTANIARKLNHLQPDIVLIGGDLYDGVAVDAKAVLAPFRDIVAPLGTFFITGNHDQYGDEASYLEAIKSVGIRVLDNEMADIDGLQIIGVDYHDTARSKNYQGVLNGIVFDPEKASIFMKHVPSDLQIAQASGVGLHLSGHTHQAQMFPLGFISRHVYKGFDYGHKSLGDMQVITSSGVGNWGPPIRVGTKSEIVLITLH